MKKYIKSLEQADIERASRESDARSAMEIMYSNDKYQNDPEVAMFWYDPEEDELFGIKSTLATDLNWYHSNQWNMDIRTDKHLHKNIWQKEYFRGKDKRFQGDHTLMPRGRVFEFKDQGFKVFTGDWIDEYPEVKQMIIDEFNLPEDTELIKDVHWDIGHGFSDEF